MPPDAIFILFFATAHGILGTGFCADSFEINTKKFFFQV